MSEKYSTGLRNQLLNGRGLREVFADSVLKIYAGTPPAEADDAEGILLVKLTKSGGVVSTKEHGVLAINTITVPGVHAAGTYNITVTVDGTTYTASYDATTYGHANNDEIAQGVCWELNKISQVRASCATVGGATGVIVVSCRIPGITLTIADGGGTITFGAAAVIQAGSRAATDTLQLGLPAAGAVAKNADTWSGTITADGTAGYFRLVTSEDLGTDNATDVRVQGAVSTAGAEMNLSSLAMVSGATLTLSTFSVTFPAA